MLDRQIKDGLDHMAAGQVAGLVVAYEPVWAIGTGRNATAAQAEERACAHSFTVASVVRSGGRRAVPRDLRRQRETGQHRGIDCASRMWTGRS